MHRCSDCCPSSAIALILLTGHVTYGSAQQCTPQGGVCACLDTGDTATSASGYTCQDLFLTASSSEDDTDFTAREMCCGLGGGTVPHLGKYAIFQGFCADVNGQRTLIQDYTVADTVGYSSRECVEECERHDGKCKGIQLNAGGVCVFVFVTEVWNDEHRFFDTLNNNPILQGDGNENMVCLSRVEEISQCPPYWKCSHTDGRCTIPMELSGPSSNISNWIPGYLERTGCTSDVTDYPGYYPRLFRANRYCTSEEWGYNAIDGSFPTPQECLQQLLPKISSGQCGPFFDFNWQEDGGRCACPSARQFGGSNDLCLDMGTELGTAVYYVHEIEPEETTCAHSHAGGSGVANCDDAWKWWWLSCAEMEREVDWDCSGCKCEGDAAGPTPTPTPAPTPAPRPSPSPAPTPARDEFPNCEDTQGQDQADPEIHGCGEGQARTTATPPLDCPAHQYERDGECHNCPSGTRRKPDSDKSEPCEYVEEAETSLFGLGELEWAALGVALTAVPVIGAVGLHVWKLCQRNEQQRNAEAGPMPATPAAAAAAAAEDAAPPTSNARESASKVSRVATAFSESSVHEV